MMYISQSRVKPIVKMFYITDFHIFTVGKRSRLEIISDILLYIKRHEAGAKPTNILYRANLSLALLKKYLNALIKDGLIAEIMEGKKTRYFLTEKGMRFIELLCELNPMTDTIEIYRDKRTASHGRVF